MDKGFATGCQIRFITSWTSLAFWRYYDVMQEPRVSSCVAKYDLLENLFSRVTS